MAIGSKSEDSDVEEESREARRVRELEGIVDTLIAGHVARTRFELHMQELQNLEKAGCAKCHMRGMALLCGVREENLPPFCAPMQGWGEAIFNAKRASEEYDGRAKW